MHLLDCGADRHADSRTRRNGVGQRRAPPVTAGGRGSARLPRELGSSTRPAELGQRGAQVDRRGGLADPPFWFCPGPTGPAGLPPCGGCRSVPGRGGREPGVAGTRGAHPQQTSTAPRPVSADRRGPGYRCAHRPEWPADAKSGGTPVQCACDRNIRSAPNIVEMASDGLVHDDDNGQLVDENRPRQRQHGADSRTVPFGRSNRDSGCTDAPPSER